MNPTRSLLLLIPCLLTAFLPAQDDELPGLAAVAEKFVKSYNDKDLDAILTLYTEQAEFANENDAVYAAGLEQIRGVFEDSFREMPDRKIALDVLSVRPISQNVMVEEGIARFSGQTEEGEAAAVPYSAILVKQGEAGWKIASSRELHAAAPAPDPIEPLFGLAGDWVLHADQMQMSLSFEAGASGRYLVGSALVSTPDEGELHTDIRIGYDASLGQVRWWTFDEMGGFSGGPWQPIDGGWLVRSSGVTADGELTSAIQELRFEGPDEIVWDSTKRFVDGQVQPDLQLRLVRRPPEPGLSLTDPEPAPAAPAAPAQ